VDVALADALERRLDGREVEPAAGAGQAEELQAAGQELRGAALVGVDVRFGVAEDEAARAGGRGEGERVRRRAGGDEEGRARALEQRRDLLVDRRGEGIVAIGRGRAFGGRGEGGGDRLGHAGPVVGGEVHGRPLAFSGLCPARQLCPEPGPAGNSAAPPGRAGAVVRMPRFGATFRGRCYRKTEACSASHSLAISWRR